MPYYSDADQGFESLISRLCLMLPRRPRDSLSGQGKVEEAGAGAGGGPNRWQRKVKEKARRTHELEHVKRTVDLLLADWVEYKQKIFVPYQDPH